MAISKGINGGKQYSNLVVPIKIDLSFTVLATNALGITSLKSNGFVNNVFMFTSTTPGSNNGQTNPNPAAGFALIQLNQNLNKYIGKIDSITPPNVTATKIDNSALTAGQVYVISTLGNATAAKWAAIGVPAGVTPAVGVAFVALSNGGAGNTLTSRVMLPSISGVSSIEVVGTTDKGVTSQVSANGGEYIYIQFLAPTSSSVTTMIPTAPADGSVISMSLMFDGSSVTVDGL